MGRYMEKNKITFKPAYFDLWKNPDDPNEVSYRYNGQYFEKDRKEGNWERLPDLYSENLPPEVEEFDKKGKKK